MSEWSVEGETWEVQKPVKLVVDGETYREFDQKPSVDEIVTAIMEAAREKGYSRIFVKLNGETLSPSAFREVYQSTNPPLTIEIEKADYAG